MRPREKAERQRGGKQRERVLIFQCLLEMPILCDCYGRGRQLAKPHLCQIATLALPKNPFFFFQSMPVTKARTVSTHSHHAFVLSMVNMRIAKTLVGAVSCICNLFVCFFLKRKSWSCDQGWLASYLAGQLFHILESYHFTVW